MLLRFVMRAAASPDVCVISCEAIWLTSDARLSGGPSTLTRAIWSPFDTPSSDTDSTSRFGVPTTSPSSALPALSSRASCSEASRERSFSLRSPRFPPRVEHRAGLESREDPRPKALQRSDRPFLHADSDTTGSAEATRNGRTARARSSRPGAAERLNQLLSEHDHQHDGENHRIPIIAQRFAVRAFVCEHGLSINTVPSR